MEVTTYKPLINKQKGIEIPAGSLIDIRPHSYHNEYCTFIWNGEKVVSKYTQVIKPPTASEIAGWMYDLSDTQTIDGYDVEPDGKSPDGFPSWLMALGII